MTNVYSDPGDFGLILVNGFDTGAAYEFDITILLKDDNGDFYLGQDSGCSCPSPFETFTDISHFRPVRSLADLSNLLINEPNQKVHVMRLTAKQAGLK